MKNFKMVATHVAELMKNLKKCSTSTSHRDDRRYDLNVTYLYLKSVNFDFARGALCGRSRRLLMFTTLPSVSCSFANII